MFIFQYHVNHTHLFTFPLVQHLDHLNHLEHHDTITAKHEKGYNPTRFVYMQQQLQARPHPHQHPPLLREPSQTCQLHSVCFPGPINGMVHRLLEQKPCRGSSWVFSPCKDSLMAKIASFIRSSLDDSLKLKSSF